MLVYFHCLARIDYPGIRRLKHFIKEIEIKNLRVPLDPSQTDPIVKEFLKEYGKRLILVGVSLGKQLLFFTAIYPERRGQVSSHFPTESFRLVKLEIEKPNKLSKVLI